MGGCGLDSPGTEYIYICEYGNKVRAAQKEGNFLLAE